MRRWMILFMMSMGIVTSGRTLLVLAQDDTPSCVAVPTSDPNDLPFVIPESLPIEGELLGYVIAPTNVTATVTGHMSDPEGDLCSLRLISRPAGMSLTTSTAEGKQTWRLSWSLSEVGIYRVVIKVLDQPSDDVPAEKIVTLYWQIKPVNHPPVITMDSQG